MSGSEENANDQTSMYKAGKNPPPESHKQRIHPQQMQLTTSPSLRPRCGKHPHTKDGFLLDDGGHLGRVFF